MDATKPYEFIGFGAMDATKPYEFIGCGADFGAGSRPKPNADEPKPRAEGSGHLVPVS